MRKYIIFLLLCCSLNLIFGQGQSLYRDPKNLYPYAPETSSFIKYRETPVSNYTGVPDISIPIYTIKNKEYELPITLTYHSGGVLLSDISGPVGLGWSLRTVNPITRKINGYVDEKGFMISNSVDNYLNSSEVDKKQLINNVVNPTNIPNADLSSDNFNLSLPDYSGKFIYNQTTSKFVTYPYSKLKIDYNIEDPSSPNTVQGGIKYFDVQDTRGVLYRFGDDGREYNNSEQSIFYNGAISWKIKYIRDAYGNGINFYYTSLFPIKHMQNNFFTHSLYKTYSADGCSALTCGDFSFGDKLLKFLSLYNEANYPSIEQIINNPHQVTNSEALIDEITFNGGRITFAYSDRLDLINLKKLDLITIYDANDNIVSKKKFNYSYFRTTANDIVSYASENQSKRLKLVSYQDCNNLLDKCVTTSFDYYENDFLPPRLNSRASDYWGFFNNYEGFLPNIPVKVRDLSKEYVTTLPGGKILSVNPDYVNSFSLKSITFPEGGKNLYIYEPNRASSFIKDFDSNSYYFDARQYPDMVKRLNSFSVSGYSLDGNIYIGAPSNPDTQNAHTKTYVKAIDISNYNKNFEMSITVRSNFTRSHLSTLSILPEALYSTFGIYYYDDNNEKKYLLYPMKFEDDKTGNFISTGVWYTKYNNQLVPKKTIYAEFSIVNWGVTTNKNIPFSLEFRIEWDEQKPHTTNSDFYVGGLRIKEIREFNQDNSLSKIWQYNYTKEDNKTSSGILFNLPIYSIDTRFVAVEQCMVRSIKDIGDISASYKKKIAHYGTERNSIPIVTGMTTQGQSVGYSRVEIKQIDANGNMKGKEIYYYNIEKPYSTYDNLLSDLEKSSLKYEFLENRDWRNGQLLKQIMFKEKDTVRSIEKNYLFNPPFFSNSSTPLYKNNTTRSIFYNLIPKSHYSWDNLKTDYLNCSLDSTGYIWEYPTEYIDYETGLSNRSTYIPLFYNHPDVLLLSTEKIIEYLNNKKIITHKNYNYENSADPISLTSVKTTFSDGSTYEKRYKYALDENNQDLLDAGMIDIPTETFELKNAKAVSRERVLYQQDSNYNFVIPKTVTKTNMETLNTINSSLETKQQILSYDKYDSSGNLLQYTTKSGIPVSILWGYSQLLPIVKIEGISYSTLMSNLNYIIYANTTVPEIPFLSAKDIDAVSEAKLQQALDGLRTNDKFKDYLITTYTYNPLIGVTSITPPSGVRELYHYDSLNRLQSVTDINGNILKEYKYNYISNPLSLALEYYNKPMSQNFTKNTCGSGYQGENYPISVSAKQYYSNLSQEDADQKALDYINSNGQYFANLYGSCTPISTGCSFVPNSSQSFLSYWSNTFSPSGNNVGSTLVFSYIYPSNNINWSSGINYGTVGINCAPTQDRTVDVNVNGLVWNITVASTGVITLKLVSGATSPPYSVPVSLNFQYQK